MNTFDTPYVCTNIADVLEKARVAPVAVQNNGSPEFVIMSAAEFARLSTQYHPPKPVVAGPNASDLLSMPIPRVGA